MSDTKKWKGGTREVKPKFFEDENIADPEDPNYIPTSYEFESGKYEEGQKEAPQEK